MRLLDDKNFLTGALYVALGAAVTVGAFQYQMGSADRMGPGYFPAGVGMVLAACGVVLLGTSLRAPAADAAIGNWPIKRLAIVLAAVVLFGLLLEPMGLVFAVPVLIGVSAMAHPQRSLYKTLLSIVVLLPAIWAIFVLLLGLQFPLLPSFLAQ